MCYQLIITENVIEKKPWTVGSVVVMMFVGAICIASQYTETGAAPTRGH
jgi:hypothetical protein